ncbi:MAG TPA: STAS domain-containing protein [Deltaproteobacteria bacterium]|jgi:anti-anti-sigma factor|nr:STAS domain-containing protein [Deltaproteobacteria bacterium]HRW80449.1 STAS domain-containing protein [Desulfomonilia bacterium]HNQ85406.1 STAS domain-containing protein [Deltaproteobacteria bacterium]HON95313.1 STAS domain-containing protein [Deltaproteobacteria bacterium]HPH50451.1 STAS domain-containing protein [Deltaproteobacteria bacterium]
MQITVDSAGVIHFKGNLVVSTIENVHSTLESLLERSSRVVTLDLSGVNEIDIAGLQLLYSLKMTFETDGALRIRAFSPTIGDILGASGFGIALKEALP